MRRRPLLPVTAIAALMLSAAAAQAQDAPASPPAAAPAHRSYSADEMSHFARATVELQNLGSQDPEQMTKAANARELTGARRAELTAGGSATETEWSGDKAQPHVIGGASDRW